MVVMLLRNYGFGGGVAVDPTVPIDNSGITFQWLPLALAVAQIFNQWAYAILTPLKFRPLVYDLKANRLNEETEDNALSMDMVGHDDIKFSITLRARGWLRAFAIAALTTGGLAVGLNFAVLGSERTMALPSFRDQFRVFPGAAVAAVGWVVCIVMLAMHILIVAVYEYMRNFSQASTFGVHFAGIALFACSLLAHASTIPGEEQGYDWFLGSEVSS